MRRAGGFIVNKTYKVIYNRTRCMYQVVSELAKGHTKSETPEMLKSLFNKHSGLTRGIVMAVLSMSLAMPVGVAVQAADTGTSATSGDTPISDTNGATTPNESVTVKDGAVLVGSGAVSVSSSTDTTKNTTTITIDVPTNGKVEANGTGLVTSGTVYTAVNEEQTAREAAVKSVTDKIGTLDANGSYIRKDAPVSSNLSTLDTQVKINTDAINTNKNAITSLENLSNVSDAGKTVIKEQAKKAVKVAAGDRVTVISSGSETGDGTITYTVTANNNGSIASGDTNLVSGGTMYTELRPDSTGTYYYISNANTTAANLIALDTNLKNVIDAIGLDADDTTTSYTSKLNKYFKVNPEVTTSDDGKTKTYAADAAANGTNSVAIGPSAQAGDKSTDATTSTTITGGTSSTAVGDSAKANGNQAVALGYSASVLNPSSGTSTDSTAIGSNATVDSASNAMALGTKATINETATNGLAIGNGAVTGSAKTTATKADNTTVEVAAAGGVNSVAIGTGATNAGNTSIALGGGASVTNDTDGNYQAVVKSDDIAIGTSAKTSASDYSTAIGKSASVSQSTDAVAIGSSATASSSNDALVLGKEAKAASAADSIAMGTSAAANSADVVAIGSSTSATGANSVVIGKSAQTTSEGGNAIGSSSTASGRSTAIGQSATANNFDALAIGNGATANADRSISLGYHAGVGTTEVKGETQTSGSLIAIGTEAGNNVAGMQNIAIGSSAGSDTKSNYNVAIGSSAGYNISYSDDSNNQNGYNVSIGYKANYQDTAANIMNAISIGEKTNAENYAVAVGGEAQATGTNSIALGYKATAADTDSMALGYNSSAANGNIAIGVGSTAPKITMSTAYLTGDAAPSTYISVGKSDNLRRISNVADGSAAQDVVTVHQLTTAYTDLENTIRGIDTTSLNTYSTTAIDSKIADVKSQIANAKTKYFSYSTSTSTLAANADNTGATATAADAMAIGPNANATNTKTLAIGNNVYATGLRSIAIGTADNPTMDSAGTTTTHNTSAEGENSIALGTSTTAQSDNSVAIGTRAQTYTTDTTKGSITGVKAVAIGYSATTAGDTSVAVGNNATVKYASGTAVGTDSLADGTNAVAIGEGSKAYSDNSTAIGQGNSITGNNTYGLGSSNKVSGAWGSVTTSGVSGYNNSVTSVSDANTMNAISGIYITGNSNSLTQNVVNNVVSDITAMGSSNTIDAGAGGTSSHPNTLSQIAIVGSGNTVQGKSSDDSKTNNIKDVTILGYNNKVDANTDTTVDFSNTQILGSNVTAKLGNSVYLGSNAAYIGQTTAASDAITSARTAADAAAEASDAYKAATTDAEKAQIKAQYEAQYLYQLNVQAMEAKGTTAGTQSYSTDETYGDGTSYTYAGSSPAGVVTVGSVGAERRIQNVAAGLVSATSTDAVNGSQLYALTRQIRFGGDNSSFGKTTAADDQNVVARGSNEAISITGGSDAVTPSITDGNTTYTVDTTKLTDNNIAVVADTDKNALHVQLASNLKNLNTAQLGSGSGDSYKETIKLDGTGTNGGQMTLAGADGTVKTTIDTTGLTVANGPKFTSSGIDAASQKINHVTAGSDDADAVNYGQLKNARTLLTKGANTTLSDTVNGDQHTYTVNVDNLAVKANGTGTTVALANGINFQNGTNTTATVGTDGTVTVSATHNKLSTVSAAANGANDDVTLTLTDADGNTVTSTGLKNTYTTVTKDGTSHTVTFARNDGTSATLSLGDLDGASTAELADAAAKATSEVTKGTNVASVTKTAGSNGQNIYTVNVDDLSVKTTDGEKKSVHLADGLVFADGTNTTATVGDNGTIKFNVSNDAIKKQAVQAIDIQNGSNVTVTPVTNADGTVKTFTIAASDLKYSADGTSKTTSLANGISFAAGSNTTAEIDNNGAIKINATHNKLNATGTATKATADNNAVTLTLNDQDGNTTTTALTDTYTTVSKDATNKKVTFKRNDGETQTLELSDLGGITEAQDKYVTGGKVTYEANGNGTAALTGNNGLTASITGLKDTKVSSGAATYVDAHGKATMTGSATLTMNDGSTATISGLKDDYITSASIGKENNHVTMTRLGGGTVDLDLNPILGKYSLSDYHLVGDGTAHDKAYAVDSNGTVTLNVVDDKNPNGAAKTIQITGLASQSGVNAGRTTVKSSDNSVTVSDSAANSDTHTYDIKVDYSKIPANLKVQYSGDNGTSGSNTMDKATAFSGTANQIVTTAADGKVSFKLADDISGIQSVTTGDAKLNTNGLTVTNGPTFTKSNIDANNQQIHKVLAGTENTDAANVSQVKAATTEVKAGTNASLGTTTTDTTDNHKIYTVNVDNLSLSQNGTKIGTGVTLKNGLDFQNGTNTTASVTADGKVSFSISNNAIKAQAKNAVVLTAGDNVTIGTPTDVDNVKTYTVSVNDLKLQVDGANKATRKLADGINFTGGTNTTADVTTDGKVTYDLKDSISLNQVQTDDSTLNTNGLTITGGPKVLKSGIDAGNKQITNVASGGDVESNAATIGDLKKAIETASAGTTASGFKTKGNYGEAVTSPLDKQLNVVGDVDTTKVAQENLSNGNVGVVTSKDTAGNATLTVKLNKDINLGESGSVTTGSTVMNNAGITNGNMSLGANGLTIQNGPKFTNNGIDAANQKVTGVANGINPNDAVNVSQLEEVKSDVTTGWTIAGKNTSGTDLTANIGKGKTVSYAGGKYATATLSVDSTTGNATLAVDAVTNTLSVGADGKLTSNGDGLTTTGAVKDAINGAYWTIQAGNATGNAQKVSAGSTITFNAGSNLSLSQDGTNFTYALNTDLQNMTSITAKDKKDNTAVLTGEGLKVSDKDGNSLTQHATEIRIHDSNAKADDTTTDVVLKKDGLHNGGHTITGVADGQLSADSKEAVNGGQLYDLQQKVTNGGWDIIGENENKSTHIGNDKTVSFKSGKNSTVSVTGTDTGAEVKVDVNTAQISTNDAHQATVTGTGLADAKDIVQAINSAAWNVQKKDGTVQQVKAGDTVTFDAGNNIVLAQNDKSFTYGLASDVNTNSIRLGGSQDTNGDWTGGIFIGKQIGGGANQNEGNYITGLANTSWDLSKVVDNRAATEAQLKEAINQITLKEQNGGFALKDESGNEKGKVSQTLGNAIAIVGDTEYESDGKTVKKAGNITTEADGTNVGGIKVKLNKNLDLSDEGSLRVGSSKVSNGAIQLGEDASANKILMDSTNGTASIGGVTVDGAKKTVNGLSNTKWTGTAVDGQAATENQLVEAINEAKTQAANSELHIKKGVYAIGKDSKGQEITDKVGKNSVSIDVVNATGTVDGQVVINDVAKASELGAVGELAANLKNPAGGPTTVVQAVNNVNQKVDDSLKQVNGDITNAVTEAKKHTEVKSADSDNNVTIDGTTTNAAGGTVYKLGLNKDHLNLGNVHIYGNEGRVTAKTVEAEMVKIDDQTRLDKTGLTTGNTMVANNRIVVGGDNGIKIEANGGQQTISGLTNTDWTGTAVHGRAATEDQLAKAISSATTTAAQNEQHVQAGTYDIQTTTDDKGNKQNKVTMKIVDGNGNDKGTVTINDVAKASNVGDTDKLAADIKNRNGGQPQTTSVVEAVNNLNEKVNNRVGDNKYSAITNKDPVQDGDSSTTAIGKLNNRMNDIYDKATQHASVSVDENLTMDDTKQNASGGTDYKIGLNKEQINLGNVTIKGNAGSISAQSMTADSFTAGDTVVNKDGVKVGDKSALTGDSLKVGGKTYVDDKGINANGKAIGNVGDGKKDTDAVNVKQLNKQLNDVKSDYKAADAELADAIQQTDAGLNEVGRAVNKLGNRLNRVGAGAAALAALHPGTYDPNDKWDFSAGIGHYHDANAVAIGAYYHPNDTTILSIGGSMGGGENMVNAGITWKMGRSGHEQRVAQPVVTHPVQAVPAVQQAAPVRPAPVTTPAPVVTPAPVTTPVPVKAVVPAMPAPAVTTAMTAAPSGDTAALTQILARQTAILEKLAQNQSQAARPAAAHGDDIFPDVPDNHWAYAYVAKLEKAGTLKGFKRPAVLKSPMMTRDDFASVLYTAMANGATTNPALNGDDSLNRLAQEFKAELKDVKP